MAEPVTILPTSRAIRSQILQSRTENLFLPRYITMGEFLQRALVAEGYNRVDDDTRTLLLLEAADFSHFQNLRIERNFFTFTQNASYLFRFFEELSGELVPIETLEFADTYGDYEEHIEILKELYRRYEAICDARRVLDPIFLPARSRLNHTYVESLGSAELVAEGYLTNFEMRTLLEAAGVIPFTLLFYANGYNRKMQQKFRDLGIDTVEGQMHRIDLSRLEIIESEPRVSGAEICCERFGERLLQAAFVKQKVYEFIEAGIAPERIAVVLPDEGFAEHLRRCDGERNFNFAMGISLTESPFVKRLEAATDFLENPTVQNSHRVNRLAAELLAEIAPHYRAPLRIGEFAPMVAGWIEGEEAAVARIIREELFYFEKILPHLAGSSLKSALYLFLNRLKSRTVDDVRGGKITVMGVLETRSVQYDGIVVVDFNEGVVPRKSEKDLFLNSATRIRAGLPGSEEREALQKLYYNNLFLRAKRVAISYVESADSVPSRFLTQLGIRSVKSHSDAQWAEILFAPHVRPSRSETEVEASYDFTAKPLSATGLKTFLVCRRRFYHRYVEGLKAHEIPRDLPEEHEIGTALHNALRDVYRGEQRYSDKEALRRALSGALKQHNGATPLDAYLHKLWVRRLDPFFDAEIERFKEAEVLECEAELETTVEGIRLGGRIDRIDRTPDGLEVLDYKSGKFPTYTAKTVESATDFQLEFYHLLASRIGAVNRCGYYDLKNGQIAWEVLLEPKLELLYGHLRELREAKQFVFDKTEKLADCRFCDYAHLCDREL